MEIWQHVQVIPLLSVKLFTWQLYIPLKSVTQFDFLPALLTRIRVQTIPWMKILIIPRRLPSETYIHQLLTFKYVTAR